jgi:hypothetical protein
VSPPGHSRGGPLTTDRPTAENPGEKFTPNDTRRRRQTPVWHTHAEVRVVVGRGERPRLLLLVSRCPGCRRPHLHQARVPFTATVRTGACGVRYMVHALDAEVAA